MKKVLTKWMVVATFLVSLSAFNQAQAQGSVSLQVFYDELQPYGSWIDHGRYGYVWMPHVGSGFVPYGSNGYWVQTAYGNTWVSDYAWGWAPFHYGRWFHDDFYGWLWVPDTVWAPAWVAWRSGGGYYGWAPLMPGLGISVSMGYYNSIPGAYWNFVPHRYVMYRNVYRHCLPRPRVTNIYNQTTVIVNNNYYGNGNDRRSDNRDRPTYFTGPSRSEIEQRNGERVPVYEVHDSNRPGRTEVSRTSVSLYKPAVDQSTADRTRTMPAKVTRDDESGRQAISEVRTRQSMQSTERTRERTPDSSRESIRRTNDGTSESRSEALRTRSSDGQVPATRSGAIRREQPTERLQPGSVDQTERDATFNRGESNREATRMRQQQDVQRRSAERQQSQPVERTQRSVRETAPATRSQQIQRTEQRSVAPAPSRSVAPSRSSAPARSNAPAPSRNSSPSRSSGQSGAQIRSSGSSSKQQVHRPATQQRSTSGATRSRSGNRD